MKREMITTTDEFLDRFKMKSSFNGFYMKKFDVPNSRLMMNIRKVFDVDGPMTNKLFDDILSYVNIFECSYPVNFSDFKTTFSFVMFENRENGNVVMHLNENNRHAKSFVKIENWREADLAIKSISEEYVEFLNKDLAFRLADFYSRTYVSKLNEKEISNVNECMNNRIMLMNDMVANSQHLCNNLSEIIFDSYYIRGI